MNFKRIRFLMISMLLIGALMSAGCSKQETPPSTQELEAEEEVEEAVAVPIEEDALTALRDTIQDEMRVFDVVAHHDAIYEQVKAQVTAEMDDAALTEAIQMVVSDYMNEQLKKRIDEGLSAIQEHYTSDDAAWVQDTVRTADLYELITVYEREYYKRNH
ncbi:hypothetical protein KHM83_10885 [Fusibacter paucivorans]|uniref:SurA N-terminal domain-containing protein n=1 Tax=Fusibacter paucivorans TaxID=76009 RepID=A0ABS5PPT6_9FIRM|nr:hypothetical protein [Fusibacter paucivorans]MBS7527185.1 hypothetical protein [Fusibacter paucivorans]